MNKKILIPNATGPTNMGDQAILLPVVNLIRDNFPNAYLTIHTTTPSFFENELVDDVDSHLYNWAVFEDRRFAVRIIRLVELFIAYFSLKFTNRSFAKGKLKKLINDYIESDLIIFIGGGYLRSQRKISQSLNLIMILFLFLISRESNAKRIVMPISFGPFSRTWHERLSAYFLKDFDLVSTREEISFSKLKKYKIDTLIDSTDTALLLDQYSKKSKSSSFRLGFTIREWLDVKSQARFEKEFVKSIVKFSKYTKCLIQPIIQVQGDIYGESDIKITKRISFDISKHGIRVSDPYLISGIKDIGIYSQIDLFLGMRMHSNILAALQGTPFVAIAYEHKTQGISRDLGMEDYCISAEDVTEASLFDLLRKAHKNRVYLESTINKSVNKIRKEETDRWTKIFQSLTID